MVCLGFVTNRDPKTGELRPVTTDYVLAKDALYQVDIAGRRFNVKQSLHPPKLPAAAAPLKYGYQPTLRDNILQDKAVTQKTS